MADIAPPGHLPPGRAEPDADPGAEPARAPRALKVAVIAMGAALVAGFAVVITTIVYRAANPEAGSAAADQGFGEVQVAAPPGAQVVGTVLDGRRALVTLRGADGRETLIILDVIRGQEVGRFALGGP
jgi:hypothetical protein